MYEAIEKECPRLEEHAPAAAIADYAEGMTLEQIAELAADPLFEVGMHTADHPYLSKCSSQEIATQLADNKQWIESLTGKPCRSVAYPLGDFNGGVLDECGKLRVQYGFSTDRRLEGDPDLQIPRVGIYQTSVNELGFKVCWGSLLVRLQGHGYFTNN
jgi:peptidoglycan/xylan/chitin deacetylase (PgdA/CDA1 family)